MLKFPKYLDNIKPYLPGKPVEELQRELGLREVVKLASNENPFGCSLFVKKAIERSTTNINRYPDGGAYYLRKSLSEFLAVEPEQIIFGNGSNEIIDMIARVFLSDGREALFFEGSFVVYRLVSQIAGGKYREVPLECDFSRNLNRMLEEISDETSVIFIDNPCNPTGFANKKEEFHDFVRKLPDNVLLVIDEAYFEYAKGHGVPDGINYIRRINPDIPEKNIIVLRTFSKAYGLAGLRIGYGIAKKEIIQILEKVRQPFNTNYLAQIAAVEALKDQDFVNFSVEENEKGKELFYEEFEKRKIFYLPTYGNFIMFQVESSQQIYEELLKKGVIVRPAFGFDNFLRVSIGREEENIKFFKALDSLGYSCK
ncbi:histidinol-phosphate aminotransferase [Persephonella hydrogeniphila]|uniref:Histidinol-phosphate aminotransferase n=1 Tax=Persephonella hydrogeniphila TaxID=198703 RepID=A0A285N1Y4_9AQUI|nr:histidinol-phosphate transaminase [Persephonella hydrogeniphila]SNZ03450.1 histidinol-phosphate aminotransferase [Persephonella hydrogeniphila]